jgi:hypothetical protein
MLKIPASDLFEEIVTRSPCILTMRPLSQAYEPHFKQSLGLAKVYTRPGSPLAALIEGGAAGPCLPDPETGFSCVMAPSLSFDFDQGDTGQLLLIH